MTASSLYIKNSTFHGLQYLATGNKKENNFSVICWAITIIASCVACVWICFVIRSKFNNTHIITAVVSSTYEVSKVPFPSVAVCNVNKVSKQKFQSFKKILLQSNVSEEDADAFGKSLGSLLTFSTFDYHLYNNKSYENIFEILQKNNYSVDILMMELQQDCKSLLMLCYIQSRPKNCSDYFEMIRTGEGYCCAFNYRGITHLLEEGYTNYSAVKKEPLHLLGYQMFGGVSAVFNVEQNDYLSPTRPIHGVTLLVSDSTHYLDVTAKSTTLEVGQRVRIEVTPAPVESASGLSQINQNDRNCWMSNEVVTMEGLYNFQTCVTICRALAIYEKCGCIPFYYPPFGYDLRRKCRLIDNQCLRSNQAYFFSVSSKESLGLNCNCKYQCSDNFYKVTTLQGKLQHSAFYAFYKAANPILKSDIGVLAVYYPKISCSKFRTDVFMSWNDTLALYGGIVNLFIGGSILTSFEIIIYLLIRNYRICRKRQRLIAFQYTE